MDGCVDVLLPLPLKNCFSYLVPKEMEEKVRVGKRVLVPFGKRKFYASIIVNRSVLPLPKEGMKEILEVLDEYPVVTPIQLKFWTWIADYYLCTLGEVCKAALPSVLKLESESIVSFNEEASIPPFISAKEGEILSFIREKEKISFGRILKSFPEKRTIGLLHKFLNRELILFSEEIGRISAPKKEIFIRLKPLYYQEEELKLLFQKLSKAKKQTELLMSYLSLSHCMNKKEEREVSKKELLQEGKFTPSLLNSLVEKEVFELYYKESNLLPYTAKTPLSPLSELQSRAKEEIVEQFKTHNVVLLHGVTSSGKTEIYMHFIKEVLDSQRNVLYLVPEIALTTQLMQRLQSVFGEHLWVYHSKYSDGTRFRVWEKMLHSKGGELVLGVRSSIFLPLENLGLVIVDEEHEMSYKQFEPAPRYHARDAAIVLASLYGAKVLLGTATPSFESYYNAKMGKYGIVELFTRYANLQLPKIEVVDMHDLRRRKIIKGYFSPLLLEEIESALDKGEQVILFQNRRGFSQMMECRECRKVLQCKNCDVSLVYHKELNRLVCHYCGESYPIPTECPHCSSKIFLPIGLGTEQIEETIQHLYPSARVSRMDLDTTRSRKSYTQIIQDFANGKTDILIGTQMVAKGLDFEKVSLVGILNADTLLNFPDFRAQEHAFQMIQQVAGRAGRKGKQGKVLIQTYSPEHLVIQESIKGDFSSFYTLQMEERKEFHYPPYYRLIYIYMKHKNEDILDKFSHIMEEMLHRCFNDENILGPDKPVIERVQTLFIRKIILKIRSNLSLSKAKASLQEIYQEILSNPEYKSIFLYYDVDPM